MEQQVAQIKVYHRTSGRGCDIARLFQPNCDNACPLRRNGLVRRRWWVSGGFGRTSMSLSAPLPTRSGQCQTLRVMGSPAVVNLSSSISCPALCAGRYFSCCSRHVMLCTAHRVRDGCIRAPAGGNSRRRAAGQSRTRGYDDGAAAGASRWAASRERRRVRHGAPWLIPSLLALLDWNYSATAPTSSFFAA